MCWIMLQYVAVCCNVLQCVTVYCSVLQCKGPSSRLHTRVWCIELQCGAKYCSALQCTAVCCNLLRCKSSSSKLNNLACCIMMQCVAPSSRTIHLSVLHCVAVCCRALQCVEKESETERVRNRKSHTIRIQTGDMSGKSSRKGSFGETGLFWSSHDCTRTHTHTHSCTLFDTSYQTKQDEFVDTDAKSPRKWQKK